MVRCRWVFPAAWRELQDLQAATVTRVTCEGDQIPFWTAEREREREREREKYYSLEEDLFSRAYLLFGRKY